MRGEPRGNSAQSRGLLLLTSFSCCRLKISACMERRSSRSSASLSCVAAGLVGGDDARAPSSGGDSGAYGLCGGVIASTSSVV